MEHVPTLRTEETEIQYRAVKNHPRNGNPCRVCDIEPIELYKFWKIIPNEFPYDKIAKRHDMIIPLRHAAELNDEERAEYEIIKSSYIDIHYRYILEATNRTKSIPAHYHLHLIEIK